MLYIFYFINIQIKTNRLGYTINNVFNQLTSNQLILLNSIFFNYDFNQ